MKKINLKTFFLGLMILIALLRPCAAADNLADLTVVHDQKLYKKAAFLMGTILTISVYGNDESIISSTVLKAFDEVKRLEKLMSNYMDDSELSKVNRLAGKRAFNCDPELIYVIEESLKYSVLTNGAFDITVSPVVNLWGFFANSNGDIDGSIPDDDALATVMPAVSYKNIVITPTPDSNLEENTISFKNPLTQIDLGAIGKGYAVDRVIQILKDGGIASALVNFAGNIAAYGSPGERDKWSIGLRDPKDISNIIGAFNITDKAVSTSGNYERYFIKDGKRYTHIIDPRTGFPVSGMMSVTVIADTAIEADALSTGIFVLGDKEGLALMEKLDNVEGAIIFEDESSSVFVRVTEGLSDILGLDLPDDNWHLLSSKKF